MLCQFLQPAFVRDNIPCETHKKILVVMPVIWHKITRSNITKQTFRHYACYHTLIQLHYDFVFDCLCYAFHNSTIINQALKSVMAFVKALIHYVFSHTFSINQKCYAVHVSLSWNQSCCNCSDSAIEFLLDNNKLCP